MTQTFTESVVEQAALAVLESLGCGGLRTPSRSHLASPERARDFENGVGMATTPEQIDLWRQSPSEHPRLEFKEAKTQFDNQTLRERFKLPEERAETASRIIRDCTDAKLIKLDNPESGSKRYARYLPFWA